VHLDAASSQRQRDPPGPDGQLERPPVASQAGQRASGRVDDRRVELILEPVVVGGRDVFAEVPSASPESMAGPYRSPAGPAQPIIGA
jgi:hypothetical protein